MTVAAGRTSLERTDAPAIPELLWEHGLFRGSADYLSAPAPLSLARVETHLRRIRNMPSSGDQTAPMLLEGMAQLSQWATGQLARLADSGALCRYRDIHARIYAALAICRESGAATVWAAHRRALLRVLPEELRAFVPDPAAADSLDALAEGLRFLDLLLLDACVCSQPELRRNYLRRAYRLAEAALQYNQTTDLPRMLPVMGWLREFLRRHGRRGLAYADVGCAFAGGAPSLALAARCLRPDGLCRTIHGTDIIAPPPELRTSLWREHRVGAYRSDTVRRPLPRVYDVILLANVHRHLNRSLQQAMLQNLGRSLTEQGLLVITWRFAAGRHPCLALARHGAALQIVADLNLEAEVPAP